MADGTCEALGGPFRQNKTIVETIASLEGVFLLKSDPMLSFREYWSGALIYELKTLIQNE